MELETNLALVSQWNFRAVSTIEAEVYGVQQNWELQHYRLIMAGFMLMEKMDACKSGDNVAMVALDMVMSNK